MAQKALSPLSFEKQVFADQQGEGRSIPGDKLAANSCALSSAPREAAMPEASLCQHFALRLHTGWARNTTVEGRA